MIVWQQRAATVLYNFLVHNRRVGPFLVPANICPIVPITFIKANIPVCAIDIAPDTLCLDTSILLDTLRKRSPTYSGVLVSHTYGFPGDFEQTFKYIKRCWPTLLIVDDRCACPPSFVADPDNPADLVLYSTGYGKHTDVGFGGYGFIGREVRYLPTPGTYSPADLDTLTLEYKRAVDMRHTFTGGDSDWLDVRSLSADPEAYQQAVTDRFLRIQEHKASLNSVYRLGVPKEVQLAAAFQGWRFNVVVDRRDELIRVVFRQGPFASAHYAALDGSFFAGSFPVATSLASRVMNLFNDHHVGLAEAARMCTVIRNHVERASVA